MKIHDLDFENYVDLNDDILVTVLGGQAKLPSLPPNLPIISQKNLPIIEQSPVQVAKCENCIIQEPVTFIQPNPVPPPQKKLKVRKNS